MAPLERPLPPTDLINDDIFHNLYRNFYLRLMLFICEMDRQFARKHNVRAALKAVRTETILKYYYCTYTIF